MKLTKKFKADWIRALKSGKYRQTTGSLRDRDGFCCLGVACEVLEVPRATGTGGYNFGGNDSYVNGVLLTEFRKEIGLPKRAHDKLAFMNDDGKDFKTIAKWIKEHL